MISCGVCTASLDYAVFSSEGLIAASFYDRSLSTLIKYRGIFIYRYGYRRRLPVCFIQKRIPGILFTGELWQGNVLSCLCRQRCLRKRVHNYQ